MEHIDDIDAIEQFMRNEEVEEEAQQLTILSEEEEMCREKVETERLRKEQAVIKHHEHTDDCVKCHFKSFKKQRVSSSAHGVGLLFETLIHSISGEPDQSGCLTVSFALPHDGFAIVFRH